MIRKDQIFKVFVLSREKCKVYGCGVSILLQVVKKGDLGDWVALHKKRGPEGGNYSLIDAPALPAMLSSIFSKQQTPQEEQKAFSFNIMNNRLKLVVKIVQNTNWNRMLLFEAIKVK